MDARPLKVALLLVALDRFGPSRAMITLAMRANRARVTPFVVVCQGGDAELIAALRRAGVDVASLEMRGPFDPRGLVRLVRLLRRERPDVVHARLQRAAFLARVARPFAGWPPVIANVVNMYRHHARDQHGGFVGRVMLAAERLTAPLASRWVANSQAVAAELGETLGLPAARIEVIANSVDSDRFRPDDRARAARRASLGVDASRVVVGTVSRLVPLKRIEWIIAAVATLPARPVLLVVGDGPSRAALEAQARAAQVDARFVGEQSDVPSWLCAMDIFAFASESEGQPSAVLEAMAAGLPVVATTLPAVDEVVANATTGAITPASPEALAASLAVWCADPSRRARGGAAARERAVRVFGIDRMVDSFAACYERAARDAARA
jgi:glycosyltransferase involved in cell wall biosynthesis